MVWVAADSEQSTMHFRMQCLHPAIENFRKAGQIGDVFDGNAGVSQNPSRSSGRYDLNLEFASPLANSMIPSFLETLIKARFTIVMENGKLSCFMERSMERSGSSLAGTWGFPHGARSLRRSEVAH